MLTVLALVTPLLLLYSQLGKPGALTEGGDAFQVRA